MQEGFPNLTKLRFISLEIAKAVSLKLIELGLTKISKPADLHGYLEALMYNQNIRQLAQHFTRLMYG
ncbi:MAG: hypothetical protein IPL23_10905 [Saprospiraceae bacterium]|nr:hypothetical protein [Saprospiraceae bacterium]